MKAFFQRLLAEATDKSSITRQFASVRLTTFWSLAIAMLIIAGVYSLGILTGTPVSELTRDPSAITKSRFYIGILSNLGILLWTASSAVCFLGAFILMNDKRRQQSKIFLLYSGAFSLLLTVDDLFLLHEVVFPNYLFIPQKVVVLAYLIVAVTYFVYFLNDILRSNYFFLLTAILFLGLSLVIDQLFPYSNLETFVEDSLKFIGINFWLVYYFRTVTDLLKESSQ